MPRFMPIDEQKSIDLNNRLAQTMFQSVPNFVSVYNDGVINRKHKDVQKIAGEISLTYRDVKERNGTFIFSSEQEVYLEEITKTLSTWTVIVKIKREIESLIENGSLSEGSKFVFDGENPGYISTVLEDGTIERLSGDRITNRQELIEEFYHNYSTAIDAELAEREVYQFKTGDFLSLDDSFIEKIYEDLPN